MKVEETVSSGEVKARARQGLLRARAIGSCVVVAAYDPATQVGAMVHVMLPAASPGRRKKESTKYAAEGIDEMLRAMIDLGARREALQVCLVGGANVLGGNHHSPGPAVARSVKQILLGEGITPVAKHLGGDERTSCTLDVASGRVYATVGDSAERMLWDAQTCDSQRGK